MTGDRPEEGRIARAISRLATAAAYIAGAVLVALMGLTTVDVAGRYFLNRPLEGVFDLTHFAVLIMVYFGLAQCELRGDHVSIELLYDRLPAVAQRVLGRLTSLAGCVLFAVIAWRLAVQSVDIRQFGETSQLMGIPLFPLYWAASAGAALFALVMALHVFIPRSDGEAPAEDAL